MTDDADYRDLMRLIHRSALLGDRVGERLFQRRIGVGRALYIVLRAIDDTAGGVVSQQSLADRLGLTKGAVSRHVSSAQQEGWLELATSPISRRENALVLTSEGRGVVEQGRRVQREYEQRISDRITDRDIAVTIRTLSVICDLLEEEERR